MFAHLTPLHAEGNRGGRQVGQGYADGCGPVGCALDFHLLPRFQFLVVSLLAGSSGAADYVFDLIPEVFLHDCGAGLPDLAFHLFPVDQVQGASCSSAPLVDVDPF